MMLVRKYCGCLLKREINPKNNIKQFITILECGKPLHKGLQICNINGIESTIINKKELTPHEKSLLMKQALLKKVTR